MRLFLYCSFIDEQGEVAEELTRQLQITGFVENLKPYDVRIIAEGEDQAIERFIERVQIGAPPIKVEHLEVRFEDVTGEFTYFEITRGDMAEELGERLDVANTRMTEMAQQQGIMIEKQEETIGEIRSLREDLKSYMDIRFAYIYREIGAIKARLGMT
jgi:acylphosphatase